MSTSATQRKTLVRFCPNDGSLLGPNKYCTRCQKRKPLTDMDTSYRDNDTESGSKEAPKLLRENA